MHHTVKVLLDLLDIFFRSHEPLHEDIKLFVQPDDLDPSIDDPRARPSSSLIVIIVGPYSLLTRTVLAMTSHIIATRLASQAPSTGIIAHITVQDADFIPEIFLLGRLASLLGRHTTLSRVIPTL
jgi:hypothetical protein